MKKLNLHTAEAGGVPTFYTVSEIGGLFRSFLENSSGILSGLERTCAFPCAIVRSGVLATKGLTGCDGIS